MEVRLLARSCKGRRVLSQLSEQLPEVDSRWEVQRTIQNLPGCPRPGPWHLVVPSGTSPMLWLHFARFVHAGDDPDFKMVHDS